MAKRELEQVRPISVSPSIMRQSHVQSCTLVSLVVAHNLVDIWLVRMPLGGKMQGKLPKRVSSILVPLTTLLPR